MKKDWAQVLFVDHPQVFLPWMKAMRDGAKTEVRNLLTIFKRFQVRKEARILDLACGIGRISINLARAGYKVVGVDISPLYLDFANKWARQDRVADLTRFYEMDMKNASRDLRRKGEKKFNVILSYGTSIGYRGQDDDIKMLKDLRGMSTPSAILVFETVNRDFLVKHFEPESVSTLEGIEWQELRRLNLENSFMENIWKFYRKNKRSRRLILNVPVSHRVYSLHELKQLFTDTGWTYSESYGNLGKLSPVTTASFHMAVIGRK